MKKILTVLLVCVLAASMSITAFAASPITTATGNDTKDVTGTYAAGDSTTAVYSVDVAWGSMEFTYTAGAWDPATHTNGGSWGCAANANKITVTNHSNREVTATVTYEKELAYNAVSATFTETSGTANDGILTLATAVGTTVANAPKAEVTVNLSGALANSVTTGTKLGTLKVTLG